MDEGKIMDTEYQTKHFKYNVHVDDVYLVSSRIYTKSPMGSFLAIKIIVDAT